MLPSSTAAASAPVVLLLGENHELLDSRRRVLEGFGFRTSISLTFDAKPLTFPPGLALAILCHTVSGPWCARNLARLRERLPVDRILVLDRPDQQCACPDEQDLHHSGTQPQELLKHVSHLLHFTRSNTGEKPST